MIVVETPPSTLGEEGDEARPHDWLEHTEGFQVFGSNGRIGFVDPVVRPAEGADGLFIRTGLFRTRTVFVPSHDVGAVVPETGRLELLIAPSVTGAPRRIKDLAEQRAGQRGADDDPASEHRPVAR
jgi:hypothetical protein